MLDSNGDPQQSQDSERKGHRDRDSWIVHSTVSLRHKADNYKAIGGTSVNILTQFIPGSHDSLRPSEARPPRPQSSMVALIFLFLAHS